MLDNGIISHAKFVNYVIQEKISTCRDHETTTKIYGLMRKDPNGGDNYQRQKEALFTIGRLIREGQVEAYSYNELKFERAKGRIRNPEFNALNGCQIRICNPAIERSRFLKTANFSDFIAKGGKKDKKDQVALGDANQIAFCTFLCSLNKSAVKIILLNAELLHLTQFEIESLNEINWFQFICKRFVPESYPDAFHLWTAERNALDAFLTLEKTLQNKVSNIRRERKCPIKINTQVLRPLDLLEKFGIDRPDPIPIELEQFYRIF